MNYVADIHGDLIFNGFETAVIAPPRSDEHDLNLSSDQILETVPVTATTLDPEQFAPSEATESAALEPHTGSTPSNISVNGIPDSSPAISSEPRTLPDTELDRLSIFEFSTADIFQHSPFGDVLNSLKNLSLMGNSWPNYVPFELEADNGEFRFPPATHFIATVEDLTDMPAYGPEDIDGIDDDADKEQGQNPPVIRRGTATPSYDVYMVDTLKKAHGDDKGDPVENKTPETQSSSGVSNTAPSHTATKTTPEK